MKEASLWVLIRSKLPGHVQRIENLVTPGAPDVNACYQGRETWIELKVAKGNWIHFRNSQLAWFAKRTVAGGSVKVLYRKGDTICILPAQNVLAAQEYYQANPDKSIRVLYDKLGGVNYDKPFDWVAITEKIYEPMSR